MRPPTPPVSSGPGGRAIFLLSALTLPLFAVVQANDPPQFIEEPRDQQVINDRVASFTCRASGNPQPRFEWRKKARRISPGNGRFQVIEIADGSILRIEPVKFNRDDAEYECVVENPAGDTISSFATLKVYSDDRVESSQMLPPKTDCS